MEAKLIDVVSKGGSWQLSGEWKPHTIGPENANEFVEGYLKFLDVSCNWRPKLGTVGLDVGAGAGYLAASFCAHGIDMVASEFSDSGVDLIKRENPELITRKLNVLDYCCPDTWDLIFCRELYPFTRVNAFSDQMSILSRLIDSLKSGGVLLFVGSDVCWPHCLDQNLLSKLARRDSRIVCVTRRCLEVLVRKFKPRVFGQFFYWIASLVLSPLVVYKKRHGWASIYVIGFSKIDRAELSVNRKQNLEVDQS